MMLLSVVFFLINTHNDGDILTFSRCGYNYFFSTGNQVRFCFFTFSKASGRFNYDLNAQFTPRQLSRICLSDNFDFFTVNNDIITVNRNFMRESAMYRVIFQKMRQSCSISQVVNGNYFYLRISESNTENLAADTAKTINTNFCHDKNPPFML